MDAAALTADLCRVFEGLRLKPYLCPAGYPTIGFGIVNKPDGTQVKMTDPPITRETAEEWLILTIKRDYMPGVLKASPILAVHPQRLAAMTDFAFNLGLARYRASTLRRRVDAEDWEGVKEELMKWTRGGGKVLPGLVKRRAAEAALMG